MAIEKNFEQRFAEIYPAVYAKLKSEETFDEKQWQVGLATEVSLVEEILTSLQKDFFGAIRASDLKRVSALIKQETTKPDFTLSVLLPSIDYWQITNPLHPSQPYFSSDIRDIIWNLIINASQKDNFDTFLRWAIVLYQSEEIIQKFIDKIQNLNTIDSENLTPLHLACFFNQEGTVESLLAEGAYPLIKDKHDNLPLRFACANNHLGIVMRLLNKMKDHSCIPDLLESGIVYADNVREALEIYAKISVKKQTMAAAFLEKNGLHATKLRSLPSKAGQNAARPITLLPHITTAWNQRVAEAKVAAETEQKRQKTGQNESHQAKNL